MSRFDFKGDRLPIDWEALDALSRLAAKYRALNRAAGTFPDFERAWEKYLEDYRLAEDAQRKTRAA